MTTTVKTPEEILGLWADIRVELEAVDGDMHKGLIKGNTAASRRARAKFREIKKAINELTKEMVNLDKSRNASKKKNEK